MPTLRHGLETQLLKQNSLLGHMNIYTDRQTHQILVPILIRIVSQIRIEASQVDSWDVACLHTPDTGSPCQFGVARNAPARKPFDEVASSRPARRQFNGVGLEIACNADGTSRLDAAVRIQTSRMYIEVPDFDVYIE